MTDAALVCGRAPSDRRLPSGFRIRRDRWTRVWADGAVLVGGSPWRISTVSAAVSTFVRRLAENDDRGLEVSGAGDAAVARVLVDRGFAHPIVTGRSDRPVAVAIPVLDRPRELAELLESLAGRRCIVVDDGSANPTVIAAVARGRGADVIRHERNRGPAAARNSALRAVADDVLAFTDSDCVAGDGWPDALVGHFADPRVAVVAPRITPIVAGSGVLAEYERARSSLDMGRHPHLVVPGGRLGFVPSAALLVRTAALKPGGFDERLRLGEDVDLVWRLADAGWLVRYDPTVQVQHRARPNLLARLGRIQQYGTSAADLEERHPGRLAPARLSAWNVAAIGLLAAGHPLAAVGVTTAASVLLARRLRALPHAPALATRTVATGLVADGVQLGRMLRCEWAPVGAVMLVAAPRSRTARLAAALMVVPLLWEWETERPRLDPVRYTALRLLDDAAYGSGVIRGAFAARSVRPLVPQIRLPEALTSWRSRRRKASVADPEG